MSTRFELIVLDGALSGLDGIALCRVIRKGSASARSAILVAVVARRLQLGRTVRSVLRFSHSDSRSSCSFRSNCTHRHLRLLSLHRQSVNFPFQRPPRNRRRVTSPVIVQIVPCFHRQGDISMIEPETYLHYIQTSVSRPSPQEWVPYDDTSLESIRPGLQAVVGDGIARRPVDRSREAL